MIPIPDGYLRREDAAVHLGIGIQTFDNQARTPDFPRPDYMGRTPLWKTADLDDWRRRHPSRRKRSPQGPAET